MWSLYTGWLCCGCSCPILILLIPASKITTILCCFYVTAIMSWCYGWGRTEVEAEFSFSLSLIWGWRWVEAELRLRLSMSWSRVEIQFSQCWVWGQNVFLRLRYSLKKFKVYSYSETKFILSFSLFCTVSTWLQLGRVQNNVICSLEVVIRLKLWEPETSFWWFRTCLYLGLHLHSRLAKSLTFIEVSVSFKIKLNCWIQQMFQCT